MVALGGPVRCKKDVAHIEKAYGPRLRELLPSKEAELVVHWLALNLETHFGQTRDELRSQDCHDFSMIYLPDARQVGKHAL